MSREASEFQYKIMSLAYRGKEVFKPLGTGWIDEHVACVREYIANVFFYRKGATTIMIDAGYNYPRLEEKMGWLGIDAASVHDILITHQDTDHVGAVEADSEGLFRDATLYVGTEELPYLTGERRRHVYWGTYTLPQVTIENEIVPVEDGERLWFDDISVEAFLVAGHTWGHMVYLVDDAYLFTGDAIWFGPDGGHSFLDALAEDNALAVTSLKRLEARLRKRDLYPYVISGHTGWTDDFDFAFARTDEPCHALFRQRPHDPSAPFDGYVETDDTEESATSGPLPAVCAIPDYANWVPRGMVTALGAGATALGAATALAARLRAPLPVRVGAAVATAASGVAATWCAVAHERFSYDGHTQLSRRIVEGVAGQVELGEGESCLDVGCGSGALTIAVAKRNPQAQVVGIDRWGAEYASFSKAVCERNAKAERAGNVRFEQGDARALPYADETFDAVVSNYVYHNVVGANRQDLLRETLRVLKKGGTFALHDLMSRIRYGDMEAFRQSLIDEGYQDVRLVRTGHGLFMSTIESVPMMLSDSVLLVGTK